MPELKFHRSFAADGTRIQFWPDEMPNQEAEFAMNLLLHGGLYVGKPENEDSAGRSILVNMPVGETVRRACDLSQKLFAEMRQRGMMLPIPSYDEATELAREEGKKN